MSGEKLLEMLGVYERMFREHGIDRKDVSHGLRSPSSADQLEHAHGMIRQMKTFVTEGQIDKAFRWLGFLQAILWVNGFFTLDELRSHNRSAQ